MGVCNTNMRGFEENGAKNACLPDVIFSHIRFSLVSSSSRIVCTSLSLLLNCSSLLRKSSSLLSICPSRIPTCASLATTITSRSDSVFSACAKRTLLRRSVSHRCITCLAMFYRLQCPWGCCSLHFCILAPPTHGRSKLAPPMHGHFRLAPPTHGRFRLAPPTNRHQL